MSRAGLLLAATIAWVACAPRSPHLAAVPRTPPAPPVIAELKGFEEQNGFERTRNFTAEATEGVPYRCYLAGRLDLPRSYWGLRVTAAVDGRCTYDDTRDDLFYYPLEAAASGRAMVTPDLAAAPLERLLMVVPHEDFHNQRETRGTPPDTGEAAATLVGLLTASDFARERYGADSPAYQRLSGDADIFLAKSRVVNDYYDRVDELYLRYRAGLLSERDALAAKQALFAALQQACGALPDAASFNKCPAAMNNAGLAFDRTYTRMFPLLYELHQRLNAGTAATVGALRRLLADWPSQARTAADLAAALNTTAR